MEIPLAPMKIVYTDQNGIPRCPNDPSLQMRAESTSKLRSGVICYKFSCPKINKSATKQPESSIVNTSTKTNVPPLTPDVGFMCIPKKSTCLSQCHPRDERLEKSGPLWNIPFSISKTVSALQEEISNTYYVYCLYAI